MDEKALEFAWAGSLEIDSRERLEAVIAAYEQARERVAVPSREEIAAGLSTAYQASELNADEALEFDDIPEDERQRHLWMADYVLTLLSPAPTIERVAVPSVDELRKDFETAQSSGRYSMGYGCVDLAAHWAHDLLAAQQQENRIGWAMHDQRAAEKRAAELERERDEARSLANALEHAAQLTEEEYLRLEDDDDAAGDVLEAVQERLMFAQAKHRTQSALAQESAKPAELESLRQQLAASEADANDLRLRLQRVVESRAADRKPEPWSDDAETRHGSNAYLDGLSVPWMGCSVMLLDGHRTIVTHADVADRETGQTTRISRTRRLTSDAAVPPDEIRAECLALLLHELDEHIKVRGVSALDPHRLDEPDKPAEPKPGDVLSGEEAKAYMLENPGRVVARRSWPDLRYRYHGNALQGVTTGGGWTSDLRDDFWRGAFLHYEYIILPPEPAKPATPVDAFGPPMTFQPKCAGCNGTEAEHPAPRCAMFVSKDSGAPLPATPDLDLAGRVGRLEQAARIIADEMSREGGWWKQSGDAAIKALEGGGSNG